MTDSKKPDDTADSAAPDAPVEEKKSLTQGWDVPEVPEAEKMGSDPISAQAAPEPAEKKPSVPEPLSDATAHTMPHDSAVPVAVTRVNAGVVAVPMEMGRTEAVDSTPIEAKSDAKSDDAKTEDAMSGRSDAMSGDAKTDEPIAGAAPGDPRLMPQSWPRTATSDDVLSDEVVADSGSFDDDFILADEIAPPSGAATAGAPEASSFAVPPPPAPAPPILPSPQEAALQAARIVSQIVDIDSESGAVIAAAAAAGAAIEAAVAAQKATAAHAAATASHAAAVATHAAAVATSAGASGGAAAETSSESGEPSPRASNPNLRASAPNLQTPPSLTAELAAGHDPVTTVRLSRDRILQALASEDIAVPGPGGVPSPRIRARTEPGIDPAADEAYDNEFDPVAIAAAAIGRLRQRARTDLAELRVHYHRHDILVLLLAFVIIVVIGRVHENLVTPPNETFSEHGLTFAHSTAWLKPEPLPMVAPRLVRDPSGGAPTKDDDLYHVELSAIGSQAKLEVLIDKKPAWSNIVTGLELDRRSRWGELYNLDDSDVRSIAGHDWLRTAYRYAHAEKGDIPRVDRAVEYATIDRDQIYVITLFGSAAEIAQVEEVLAPSLRVQSQTALPLVPETGRFAQKQYPSGVGRAFDSTVMVVVADLVDGRLMARGGGSGVVVGAEGSILTNYHVLHDKDGRLHDTFVIGRFASLGKAPQLQCAGRPNRSKLLREMDLALIKCDMDLDGRTWSPTQGGVWPTLPEMRASDVKMGQRLWVLGYPDVGGGGLRWSTGEVEGWTGEDGAQGKDFIKTDASITHGNSGGPVIDDNGRLVGVAAAFRTRMTANGGVIETAQVGLVRPLQAASNLLAYAAAGWTPREGYTDVELTPTAIEAAAEGVRIYTTVVDDANDSPVRDATVMVLKPGISPDTIDMNRLDDQAIAWGKTNMLGEVRLKQLVPVPGSYTVMVVAPGYDPLISNAESELKLDDKTPPSFDPWGKIGLHSR